LPVAYRSVNALARYIQSQLVLQDEDHPTASGKIQIQSITFPPNHLAPQGKPSRCKGFAFVVLESPALVDSLCRSYPWDSSGYAPNADSEAVKFGLRILLKTSWERMKVEYLAYQQLLLSQVAEKAAEPQVEVEKRKEYSEPDCISQAESPPREIQMQPSWLPQNCLVFVRNIHPDTNKTTLRTLFGASLVSSKGSVDYVDFSKGIDTVGLFLIMHLRFSPHLFGAVSSSPCVSFRCDTTCFTLHSPAHRPE
jgi:xRRM domain